MAERKKRTNDIRDIRSPLEATTHWCLIFVQPLSQVPIAGDTPCTLQGLVLWQNLSSLLGEHYLGFGDQFMAKESAGYQAWKQCQGVLVQ